MVEKSREDVWLGWIRGLLGLLVGIELFSLAYVLQNFLNVLSQTGYIPASLIPLLNFTQVTVIVAIASGILLILGLPIRFRERLVAVTVTPAYPGYGAYMPAQTGFPAPIAPPPVAAPTPAAVPSAPTVLVCPTCGRTGTTRFCPDDGAPLVPRSLTGQGPSTGS